MTESETECTTNSSTNSTISNSDTSLSSLSLSSCETALQIPESELGVSFEATYASLWQDSSEFDSSEAIPRLENKDLVSIDKLGLSSEAYSSSSLSLTSLSTSLFSDLSVNQSDNSDTSSFTFSDFDTSKVQTRFEDDYSFEYDYDALSDDSVHTCLEEMETAEELSALEEEMLKTAMEVSEIRI